MRVLNHAVTNPRSSHQPNHSDQGTLGAVVEHYALLFMQAGAFLMYVSAMSIACFATETNKNPTPEPDEIDGKRLCLVYFVLVDSMRSNDGQVAFLYPIISLSRPSFS